MGSRKHGDFEYVDGEPTVWVRLGGPDGPLAPVRRPREDQADSRQAERMEAMHALAMGTTPLASFGVGTHLSIRLKDGTSFSARVERPADADLDGTPRLITNAGTLRRYPYRLDWWRRPQAGEPLTCIEVDAIERI